MSGHPLHVGPSSDLLDLDDFVGPGRTPVVITQRPRKKIHAHVYNPAGAYIRTWPDIASQLQYSWNINGGQSATTVELARAHGRAGEPGEPGSLGDLAEGNIVKFYLIDRDTGPEGILQYQGIIQRHSIVQPARETAKVTLVPRSSVPADSTLKGPIHFNSQDPLQMLIPLTGLALPGITLDPTNPAGSGLIHTDDFERMKMNAVLEKLRFMAGSNWFWRLNPDYTLTFNEWNTRTPDHVLKPHNYESVEYNRDDIGTYKRVFVYGAKTEFGVRIIGEASVPGYDPTIAVRDFEYADESITDQGTANVIAASLLQYGRRPLIESVIEVPDSNLDPVNGYDIESFKPGQSLQTLSDYHYAHPRYGSAVYGTDVYGGNFASLVNLPLVIAGFSYNPNRVTLQLTTRPYGSLDELIKVRNRQLVGASR